jgi:hypothetical protein
MGAKMAHGESGDTASRSGSPMVDHGVVWRAIPASRRAGKRRREPHPAMSGYMVFQSELLAEWPLIAFGRPGINRVHAWRAMQSLKALWELMATPVPDAPGDLRIGKSGLSVRRPCQDRFSALAGLRAMGRTGAWTGLPECVMHARELPMGTP